MPSFLIPKIKPQSYSSLNYIDYLNDWLNNAKIRNLLLDGYDNTLKDLLEYENCYGYYNELRDVYTIYAQSARLDDSKFYFNQTNPKHIVISSRDSYQSREEIIAIILHEIQHYIQNVEGFSGGGNLWIGQLIASVGGRSVKQFMFFYKEIIKKHESLLNTLTEEQFIEMQRGILRIHSIFYTGTSFFKKYENVNYLEFKDFGGEFMTDLLSAYLIETKQPNYTNKREFLIFIQTYYGVGFRNYFIDIENLTKKIAIKSTELLGKGWTSRDINSLYFSCYETILGELEARYTMVSNVVDEEIKDYFNLYSSETIKKSDIALIDNSILFDE
jgi:hypothetical protein